MKHQQRRRLGTAEKTLDWTRDLDSIEHAYANHPRYYIAYGSNLNVLQMQWRCSTAEPVRAFELRDWKLVFSRVATVEPCKGAKVPVAVWKVKPLDTASLDSYEGYPNLYGKNYLRVNVGKRKVTAFMYTLNDPYNVEPPTRSYYQTIAEGYDEFGMNHGYLAAARADAEAAEVKWYAELVTCGACGEELSRLDAEQTKTFGPLCSDCADVLRYGDHTIGTSRTRRASWEYDYDEYTEKWLDEYFGTAAPKGSEDFDPKELDWSGRNYRALD